MVPFASPDAKIVTEAAMKTYEKFQRLLLISKKTLTRSFRWFMSK